MIYLAGIAVSLIQVSTSIHILIIQLYSSFAFLRHEKLNSLFRKNNNDINNNNKIVTKCCFIYCMIEHSLHSTFLFENVYFTQE